MMMKQGIILVLISGLAVSSPTLAKKQSNKTVTALKYVTAQVTKSAQRDTAVKATKELVAASISDADVNRDGTTDYAVNYSRFNSPGWCGTGGCRYQLWVGAANGTAKLVFDQRMRDVRTRNGVANTIYDFGFHGSLCGKTGAEECLISFAYNPAAGAMSVVPSPGKKKAKYYADPIDSSYRGR